MKTPLGQFRIAEKIGAGEPIGTVFKNRQPVGLMDPYGSSEDLVMSRILWLDGVEEHNFNTRNRYIYIHGTNQEEKIGTATSHGCIRMKNVDLVELFDLIGVNTTVTIEA